MKNLSMARMLFESPAEGLAALREAPVFALPMCFILIGITAVTCWYFSKVDVAWLASQMSSAGSVPADQQQYVASRITRSLLLQTSGIVAPLMVFFFTTLGAVYFRIAGNIVNLRYSFRQWFALSWWAASPQIIAFIPIVMRLSMGGTLRGGILEPLSLNEFIFQKSFGAPGYSLLSSVSLFQAASLWLTYSGVRIWSGKSGLFSFAFTLIPLFIVYGAWAFWEFR